MRTKHIGCDILWITVFGTALVGSSLAFIPNIPAVQLAVVPIWFAYWILTRSIRVGIWTTIWGGSLLEWAWGLPSGSCILPFWGICLGCYHFQNFLPKVWLPVHGLLLGVVLAPALRLWIWVYTELFYIGGNHELTPSLGGMFIMPASGALCGAIIFALAHRLDFQVLHPVHEESLRHAD